jgi:hypothetical protein
LWFHHIVATCYYFGFIVVVMNCLMHHQVVMFLLIYFDLYCYIHLETCIINVIALIYYLLHAATHYLSTLDFLIMTLLDRGYSFLHRKF